MTKQEKIDWGLRRLIAKWTNNSDDHYIYMFSKAIREYEDSEGVVIKVDRELPQVTEEARKDRKWTAGFVCGETEMVKAGYVSAVEPLISKQS